MTVALETALSGLKAAQKQLDVTSNNIANASTQGYTRKTLPTETLVVAGQGHGVSFGAVQRTVSNTLLKDLQTQTSISQGANVLRTYLDRIQSFNGPSESNTSLAAAVSTLAQSFTTLSSTPDDPLALQRTLTAAQQTATKFNSMSTLLTNMRNEAEQQINASIAIVNTQLKNIAEFNLRIEQLSAGRQSSADLEDQRDEAIRIVAQYIDISTYKTGTNTIVVNTRQGHKLADGTAEQISFTPGNLLPTSYYPGGGINGIMLGSTDLTTFNLGGEIGTLINLRDEILPGYQAQIDELAQKMSARINEQGLALFTDVAGNVPASVASPTPPPYAGYAATIRVNSQVVADPSLIRSGTNGNTLLPGSNEVIRKVALFAFGAYSHQTAQGTADLGAAATVFASTGMQPVNAVVGTTNIASYTPDLASHPDITAGASFTLNVGGVPQLISINPGDTATDLVNNINAAFGTNYAALNGLGQIRLNANTWISLTNSTIGAAGMAALGLSFGIYNPTNPSFTVQVGTQAPVTLTITPATTPAALLATLNAVPGLVASLNGSNQLVLTPAEGGDLQLSNVIGDPLGALGMAISNVGHTPFRTGFLGPDGGLTSSLLPNATLESYGRNIISNQSEDARTAQNNADTEENYLLTLDKRAKDTSGVNLDQEMAEMIRIQANYQAAAKIISTAERLLDELFNTI